MLFGATVSCLTLSNSVSNVDIAIHEPIVSSLFIKTFLFLFVLTFNCDVIWTTN